MSFFIFFFKKKETDDVCPIIWYLFYHFIHFISFINSKETIKNDAYLRYTHKQTNKQRVFMHNKQNKIFLCAVVVVNIKRAHKTHTLHTQRHEVKHFFSFFFVKYSKLYFKLPEFRLFVMNIHYFPSLSFRFLN